MNELRILLIGIGGYGTGYVEDMAARAAEHRAKVVGVVDPYAEKSPVYETARRLTDAFYDSPEAFYRENTADLAIICTPIPLHAPQAIYCMENGSHVLCEKPIAGNIADAQRMAEARDRTGKMLAVGFQWCYDPAMLAFRRDVQAGVYGKLLSMKALVLWPRDIAYYTRSSGWAGKKYDKHGNPIFDSVASNATAHYLENMLWVSGKPLTGLEAVTARANPIETFDTVVLRGKSGDAELFYAASHAAGRDHVVNPTFEYIFEKGTARYTALGDAGCELIVRLNDGTEKNYGLTRSSTVNSYKPHVWKLTEVIRHGGDIDCTAEQAMLHTRVISGIHETTGEAYAFPADRVRLDNGMYWVPGLGETLKQCWEQRILPAL